MHIYIEDIFDVRHKRYNDINEALLFVQNKYLLLEKMNIIEKLLYKLPQEYERKFNILISKLNNIITYNDIVEYLDSLISKINIEIKLIEDDLFHKEYLKLDINYFGPAIIEHLQKIGFHDYNTRNKITENIIKDMKNKEKILSDEEIRDSIKKSTIDVYQKEIDNVNAILTKYTGFKYLLYQINEPYEIK